MIKAKWLKYPLKFRFRAGTSRGFLTRKLSYLIVLNNAENQTGIGECGPLQGLSPDHRSEIEEKLTLLCREIEKTAPSTPEELGSYLDATVSKEWPSLKMGLETAFRDLFNGGSRVVFNNQFIKGKEIPINGLIWMGSREFMIRQIDKKIREGFRCVKMKIGALGFEEEIEILKYLRKSLPGKDFSIRVDANGAFTNEEALRKLDRLHDLGIHSIEQPIQAGQPEKMAELCRNAGIPVALDEELIGPHNPEEKEDLLDFVKPSFIVLKPTLLGGFLETEYWIRRAQARDIGWWITSALESNIGLNAIAQFTLEHEIHMEQGLGTGQLYTNNISSPLEIKNGSLGYNVTRSWDLSALDLEEV
jgi:o-succinylbenzoate synthase